MVDDGRVQQAVADVAGSMSMCGMPTSDDERHALELLAAGEIDFDEYCAMVDLQRPRSR